MHKSLIIWNKNLILTKTLVSRKKYQKVSPQTINTNDASTSQNQRISSDIWSKWISRINSGIQKQSKKYRQELGCQTHKCINGSGTGVSIKRRKKQSSSKVWKWEQTYIEMLRNQSKNIKKMKTLILSLKLASLPNDRSKDFLDGLILMPRKQEKGVELTLK